MEESGRIAEFMVQFMSNSGYTTSCEIEIIKIFENFVFEEEYLVVQSVYDIGNIQSNTLYKHSP